MRRMMIDAPMDTAAKTFLPAMWIKAPSRASHTGDVLSESDAHAQLLGSFASAVPSTLQQAVEVARRLFKADAAGIHLCGYEANGSVTHLDVIAGALSIHEDPQASMGHGLFSRALHAGVPIVLSEQEIELTFLRNIRPRVVHLLMAPIYDGTGKPLGAVWLAQITSPETYSRVDALALERLTHVLAAGLTVSDQTKELEQLRATVESERVAHCSSLNRLTAEFEQKVVLDDVAVREAHHRVKNTLQIVSSVLSLQANATNQTDARSALLEASARLGLLMQAHEQLYRAGLGSQGISVASLLRVIADTLPPSFSEIASRVGLELTAADIFMPPAEASAIALIANEVLTNAYKHAFANDGIGSITVRLERDSESVVILRISDTGSGGGVHEDSGTFGIWLVRKLAKQLGATLEFSHNESAPGTLFTLKVPIRANIYSARSTEHKPTLDVCLSAPNVPAQELHS